MILSVFLLAPQLCAFATSHFDILDGLKCPIIFKRFKSKGPEFKGQKLASEKSRGTVKTLKRHITVIKVYSSIFKIARYLNIITRYRKILIYFNVISRRSMVH